MQRTFTYSFMGRGRRTKRLFVTTLILLPLPLVLFCCTSTLAAFMHGCRMLHIPFLILQCIPDSIPETKTLAENNKTILCLHTCRGNCTYKTALNFLVLKIETLHNFMHYRKRFRVRTYCILCGLELVGQIFIGV